MSLFETLFGSHLDMFASTEKKISKYAQKIRNKDTPVEERGAIAEWLAEEGSPEAIVALLGRFEMTYEHSMKDQQEKAFVTDLVLELGDASIGPLEVFLRRSKTFARPIDCYEKLAGTDQAKALILELLDIEFNKSGLKPGKKRHLLIKLADYSGLDVTRSAVRFMDDFDEGCRYAAVEVLAAQEETDEIRAALLAVLADPNEDSGRVKHRVGELAAARAWPLGAHAEAIAAAPPENFKVSGGLLVSG
jgi:hypothetical protein